MSDTQKEIGALRRASADALAVVSRGQDQTPMFEALSCWDDSLRARQIAFWRSFLRERSLKIKEMRASNPEVFGSLPYAATVAQLVAECTRKDGLEPACMEDVLALSTSETVPDSERVMEALPPAWFLKPDPTLYKRLFPKPTTLVKYWNRIESFVMDGAVEFWRWLTAEPQPSPLDKAISERLASADFAEGRFVRVQDGKDAADQLLRILKDSLEVISVQGCTVVTMMQMRSFPCDVASALSWLCREDIADAIFFKVGNEQLCGCGFCVRKEPGTKYPSFVPGLLTLMHNCENLEGLLKQKGEQVNALIKQAKVFIRNGQKQRARQLLSRKRRIEDTIDVYADRLSKLEEMKNSITQGATEDTVIKVLSEAVDVQKQMFKGDPEMKRAVETVDETNDALQNAQEIGKAIAGEPTDLEEFEEELKSLEETPSPIPNKRRRVYEEAPPSSMPSVPADREHSVRMEAVSPPIGEPSEEAPLSSAELRANSAPEREQSSRRLPSQAVQLHADGVPEGDHSDLIA